MKVQIEKSQLIFIIAITIICIVAIGLAVYVQFFATEKGQDEGAVQIDQEALKEEFNNAFQNTFQKDSSDLSQVKKKEESKELVFSSYEKQANVVGKYEMQVSIPSINIQNDTIQKYNEEIVKIFQEKANSILNQAQDNTIYEVKYAAYINQDILSLAIRSTLKEGSNAQRVILKTYTYNLKENKEMKIEDILAYKNLETSVVQDEIQKSIKAEIEQAKALNEIGYTVYNRDLRSEVYQVHNSNNFLLGKDNHLYLIYPYGNANYTSEMDVVVFK